VQITTQLFQADISGAYKQFGGVDTVSFAQLVVAQMQVVQVAL
jgi:hypothetical protein